MNSCGDIYAKPRDVKDIKECYFYHTIELPGFGVINGEWDLRSGVDEYWGNYSFENKRVLEVGTANGFLCFEMEKRGAEVVGYDLSDTDMWDIVPFEGIFSEDHIIDRRKTLKGINNAWWLAHHLFNSKSKAVYGTVYDIPKEIGKIDVATFGSILLHLRDPFLALQKAAALSPETMIITEWQPKINSLLHSRFLPGILRKKIIEPILNSPRFLPDPDKKSPWDTWWFFSPDLIVRFLKILGFSNTVVTYHKQKYTDYQQNLFTVVGSKAKS